MVKHIVLFSFKEDADEAAIMDIDSRFKALPSVIPEVLDFESGVNSSPENLNKDFTHVYSLSFADEAARDIYLYHSSHQAFSESAAEILDDVLVVDYEL